MFKVGADNNWGGWGCGPPSLQEIKIKLACKVVICVSKAGGNLITLDIDLSANSTRQQIGLILPSWSIIKVEVKSI